MHHSYPVAQGQHFVEVVRDQQHGSTRVARGDELLLHIGHCADVQPPGGLVRDDQLGWLAVRSQQRPTQDQLLHIAARQCPRRALRPAAAHVEMRQHVLRMGTGRRAAHPQQARKGGAAQAFGHGVLPHRQVTHHPHGMAVFGDTGDTLRHQPGRACLQRLAQQQHAACAQGAGAAEQLSQRHLAVARHTGHGHDLARVQAQVHVAQMLPPRRQRVGGLQHTHGCAHVLRGAAHGRGQRMAHHPLCQLGLAGALGWRFGHHLAVAQHHQPVRHTQHLGQLVADEDDGQPLRHHLAQGVEQGLALLRGEHGGGLVEDEDARAAVQRLEDFHPLALPHRQAAHAGVQRHLQAEAGRHRLQPFGGLGAAAEGLPQRLGAHEYVVQHGEVVGQGEVLVHHADARSQRRLGCARRQRLAEHLDLPAVGGVVAEQDGHQRGLARAVLAQQGQHLARMQRERNGVVGRERTEAFGDARQTQDRGRGCGRLCHGFHCARKASSTLAELSAAIWKNTCIWFSPAPPPARSLSERKAM